MKGIKKKKLIDDIKMIKILEKKGGHFEKKYHKDRWERIYDSYDEFHEEILREFRQSRKIPTIIQVYSFEYYFVTDEILPTEEQIWLYKGIYYSVNLGILKDIYTDEQIRLILMEEYDKERKRFERLKRKYELSEYEKAETSRPSIPERVRIEVWRRDEGKCVKCGSRERLEYDHIIPVSKGGSNTTRNIELLCEQCNRRKGSQIK